MHPPSLLEQIQEFRFFSQIDICDTLELGKIYRPADVAIMLIEKGSIEIRYNLSEYTVEAKSLLFVIPNAAYEFNHISDNITISGLRINREYLGSAFHSSQSRILDTFSSGFQPFYTLDDDEADSYKLLYNVIHKLISKTGHFYEERRKAAFFTLFYEAASIYQKHNSAYKVTLNRPQELSVNFLKLVSLHCKEDRSVQYYAGALFVSARHLTQTVKEVTGRTAGEFIDRAVVLEAKLLLRDATKTIGQVASDMHFSDQFFFTKFFKRHTGLTPSEYRASL